LPRRLHEDRIPLHVDGTKGAKIAGPVYVQSSQLSCNLREVGRTVAIICQIEANVRRPPPNARAASPAPRDRPDTRLAPSARAAQPRRDRRARRPGRQVTPGQGSVDPLVDASKLVGPEQPQDPPSARAAHDVSGMVAGPQSWEQLEQFVLLERCYALLGKLLWTISSHVLAFRNQLNHGLHGYDR
jgi:hypothetical protein